MSWDDVKTGLLDNSSTAQYDISIESKPIRIESVAISYELFTEYIKQINRMK